MELKTALRAATAIAALAISPNPAMAQDLESAPAAGAEIFYSSDSDDTEIVRTAIDPGSSVPGAAYTSPT